MAESQVDHKVLMIGGSAGSLTVVLKFLPLLQTQDLSVIIIFHRKPTDDPVLLDILSTKTNYLVKEADDKDSLLPGVVYVAPADYHLLVEKDWSITLDDSEKVNYSRPSIDVAFESAAEACGGKLRCVLLSGANADGAKGIAYAKMLGAKVAVQNPTSAEVPFMPQSALSLVQPDLLFRDEELMKILEL